MPITTRNAKDWLESVVLDDPTMGGVTPSTVDVPSQASVKTYTDSSFTASNDYADSGDSATLSSANGYADAQDTVTLGSAQSYADAGDAATLAAAEAYADGVAGDSFAWPVIELTDTDFPYTATNVQTAYRFVPSAGGTYVFTLPSVTSSNRAQQINIIHDNSGVGAYLQVDAASGETIEGFASKTLNPGNILMLTARDDTIDRWTITGAQYFRDNLLDEDTFTSNSATKAASQQSIKAYVDAADTTVLSSAQTYADNKLDSLDYLYQLSISDVDQTDSPITAEFGATYNYDDIGGSATVINLPAISGGYGKRINLLVERNAGGITINANGTDWLDGVGGSVVISAATVDRWIELVAVNGSQGASWFLRNTAITT